MGTRKEGPGMAKPTTYSAARKKSRRTLTGRLLVLSVSLLVIYAVATLITQQSQIKDEQTKTAALQAKIEKTQQQNDEFRRLLSSEDENEYIERIAIERLGYAYPGERRFYVIESGE
ncbi:MAG: septum formation initiator family protein [Oscillospiraceae bacterium]